MGPVGAKETTACDPRTVQCPGLLWGLQDLLPSATKTNLKFPYIVVEVEFGC